MTSRLPRNTPRAASSWSDPIRYRHVVGALLVVGLALAMLIARDKPSSPEMRRGVVVVPAARPASAAPRASADASAPLTPGTMPMDAPVAMSDASDDPALARDVASAFPMLEDVKVQCAKECVLTSRAYEDRDKNFSATQLPYMGRLEDLLRQRRLVPIDGLMIEDQGGGETMLRVKFARP